MNTSSLGGVIGFGAAFSTLIEPGTMPELSWSLFQSLTLISFLGVGLGAGIGLVLTAYFAAFVVRRYTKKSPVVNAATAGSTTFEVGDMAYGT